MELLETQDPEKKKLIETSDRHKKALEKELGEMQEKTDRMLTNALIIGGTLAVTYFVISALSKGRKKKKKNKIAQAQVNGAETDNDEEEDHEPSVLGLIGTRVLNEATAILLSLAKEKLAEYLASRKNVNENP